MNIKLTIAICVLSLVYSSCKNDDEIIVSPLGAAYPLELVFDGIEVTNNGNYPNKSINRYYATTSCEQITFTISHDDGSGFHYPDTPISMNDFFITENGIRARHDLIHIIPEDGIIASGDWGNILTKREYGMVYYTFTLNENSTGADREFDVNISHTLDFARVYITQSWHD